MHLTGALPAATADPKGELVVGWPQQADYLWAKYADVPLAARVPQVMWRGRVQDPEHPDRDALRSASYQRPPSCRTPLMPQGSVQAC